MFTFERKFNKEREDEIRISFALVAARNDTLFTHVLFSFLISRAMMATLVKKSGSNIPRMATRISAKLRS
jgi:hypothetical protein